MASEEIPAKYKACVYDNPGTLSTKVIELDTPTPGPGQVLVKLSHSGVCHSDLSIMLNAWPMPPTQVNQVGGHEGVGTIVALGPGVTASPPENPHGSIRIGGRVGVKWMSSICGSCPTCLAGHDAMCTSGTISGYSVPGTFAQYVLAPANYVTPIPDGVSAAEAAPMLCGGITAYSALRKSGAVAGNWVVMFGAGGGLGHLGVQMASKGMGFRVIGVDHSSKKEVVLDSGAEHFVAFDEVDVVKEAKKLSDGLGAHASINFTPNMGAYGNAIEVLRTGGTMCCVGIPEGTPTPIPTACAQTMIFQALKIVGVAVGNRQEAIECLDLMKRGVVKMHYKEETMDGLTQVFQDMLDGKLRGRVVVDLWK